MIRVGPAGWAYKDWEGIVYPKPKPRGFDPVAYLARFFDTIEINSSFYGPPRPAAAKAWAEHAGANPRFRFTAKLYKAFTHDRKATQQDEADFKKGVEPLMESGRLGTLLMQFPWSFRKEPENRIYVRLLRDRFADYPLVIEVRHASWIEPDVLDELAESNVGLSNIDQPLFRRSVKPMAITTSAIGYVRLHGRNYREWFSKKAGVRARYDYLYAPQELEPWVDRIRAVADDAEDTYVVTNNHNLGKAVVNAFELKAFLTGQPIHPPRELVERYPDLAAVMSASRSGE